MRAYRIAMTSNAPNEGFGAAAPLTGNLTLPTKPSIAVLPFQNMSGDPEQEYFADGIVEDITTGLSHIKWLFVIARNSSFTYKGRAVDVRQMGRELGVRYVLEGGVRKAGNRLRITAQLVEATSGARIFGPTALMAHLKMSSTFRTRSRTRSLPLSNRAFKGRKSSGRDENAPKTLMHMTSSSGLFHTPRLKGPRTGR